MKRIELPVIDVDELWGPMTRLRHRLDNEPSQKFHDGTDAIADIPIAVGIINVAHYKFCIKSLVKKIRQL